MYPSRITRSLLSALALTTCLLGACDDPGSDAAPLLEAAVFPPARRMAAEPAPLYRFDGTDRDGDNWSPGEGDCDDEDPLVYPYARERLEDGLDNDCDGVVDAAHGLLPLAPSEAGSREVDLGFSFPFCGAEWETVFINDNGSLSFGEADRGGPVDLLDFLTRRPTVAGLRADLDPTVYQAGMSVVAYEDALAVRWHRVPTPTMAAGRSEFSIVLQSDGGIVVDLERAELHEALVGWSCGVGEPPVEHSLTGALDGRGPGQLVLGEGTEPGLWEFYETGRVAVEGEVLRFVGQPSDGRLLDGPFEGAPLQP